MIDPITVLNSSNTYFPGVILGVVTPNGADGYRISVSMEWLHGVTNYILQPVLLILVLILMLVFVDILFRLVIRT